MAVWAATSLAQVGKVQLLSYAKRAFTLVEQTIADLTLEQFQQPHRSILPEIGLSQTDLPYFYGARNVTLFDEVLFQVSHASHHHGMIEALRGVLFTTAGTASI